MSELPVTIGAKPETTSGAKPVTTSRQLPSTRQAVLATLIVLGIALGFWMVWRFRFVALAVIAAAFLHVGMKPAVEALRRRGLKREYGVILVYSVLLLAITGFLLVLAPMLAAQVGKFTAELPDYYRLLRNSMLASDIDLFGRIGRLLPPGGDTQSLRAILTQVATGGGAAVASPWALVGGVGEGLFFAIAVMAMAFYWTMDRDRITYALVLRTPVARRDDTRDLIAELESKIGAFIRGQLILCSVIGVLSLIAYLLIGLPYALALAAVAFIFEAVPMVGPALTAVVAGIVAASVGPDVLLWTLVAALVIQTAENNIIVPRVMDKTVGVNPIVTLLAITAFGLMFGLVGALLAIPLAAMIQVFIDRYLFQVDNYIPEAFDETGPAAQAVQGIDATVAAAGRSHLDVLRNEAVDLALDVRKQLRTSDIETPAPVAAIEDLIEQTALELSTLLAAAAQPSTTAENTPGTPPAQVQPAEVYR